MTAPEQRDPRITPARGDLLRDSNNWTRRVELITARASATSATKAGI